MVRLIRMIVAAMLAAFGLLVVLRWFEADAEPDAAAKLVPPRPDPLSDDEEEALLQELEAIL